MPRKIAIATLAIITVMIVIAWFSSARKEKIELGHGDQSQFVVGSAQNPFLAGDYRGGCVDAVIPSEDVTVQVGSPTPGLITVTYLNLTLDEPRYERMIFSYQDGYEKCPERIRRILDNAKQALRN
jgi:hypothetical protein